MAKRRLRKKRIAVFCIILIAGITLITKQCVSSCSSSQETTAKDSISQPHLNDSINNTLTDGAAYHEMDSVIERYLKRWEINGAQLVISRNDSLLYARGFGYADKEKGIKMEPNMLMRFASVSKLITAVGIMKLWEMKKIKMNEKVFGAKGILNDTTYNNSIKDPRYYDITVEQLLRHKAGFNNYAGDPMFSTRYIIMQNHLTTPPDHKTLLRILLKRHLGYTPGQARCYSNLGYMLLSMIIEKKSGMKYEDFMQNYVLRPAGCFDMHIAGTYYKDMLKNAAGYEHMEIRRMSALTRNLLKGIDYEKAAQKREENYEILAGLLGSDIVFNRVNTKAPFVYPYFHVNGPELRKRLAEHKIFVPVYWKNVMETCDRDSLEYHWAADILPLPCDQRYGPEEMEYMAAVVKECEEIK